MSTSSNELKGRASAWQANDPDPETAAEIGRMLSEDNVQALSVAFGPRLQFGTAGLRGRLGPGPAQMNRVLVRQVATGLGDYVGGLGLSRTAVIGFDGRKNSAVFAADSARVLAAKGFRVFLYEQVVATPVLSHAVVELGVSVGIMVTASHNPPQDNGYKVYWGNGAQIIPPHDAGISAAIDQATVPDLASLSSLVASGAVSSVPADCLENYYQSILALRVQPVTGAKAIYTAMHGVGGRFVVEALRRAGHVDLIPEPSQFDPDGAFPTVAFPNPEEPGAMDRSLALAVSENADVVLANDPDADRLAVGVRRPDGSYQMLSGNEVGLLLAETLLKNGAGQPKPMVATTIVSSTMLQKIATAHGAQYTETLTGFKWIANQAIEHDASGGAFVLGFEEALGYSVGSVVRDKDGVSALLLILDLASVEKAAGRTLLHTLEDLYRHYGLFLSEQVAFKLPGSEGAKEIDALMKNLRDNAPDQFGELAVVSRTDLLSGSCIQNGVESRVALPSSNVLAFVLEDGSRVLARPSGTEPKIKFYFEVQAPVVSTLAAAKACAQAKLVILKEALLQSVGL
jgi:phosphomannomutase